MNWTEILADGGIPDAPGYHETVAAMKGAPAKEKPAPKKAKPSPRKGRPAAKPKPKYAAPALF